MHKREPILFVPGLICDGRVWQHQISVLQRQYQCVVCDISSCQTLDEVLAVILNQVEGPFTLAGHSMGGWVAMELALKFPDRVHKLCLLNTCADSDTETSRNKRKQMVRRVQAQRQDEVVLDFFNRAVLDKPHPEIMQMFKDCVSHVINQQEVLLHRHICVDDLANITIPTLVLHSDKDAIFALSIAEGMHKVLPHSDLLVVKECGHMSTMEKPEAVTAMLVQWLAKE